MRLGGVDPSLPDLIPRPLFLVLAEVRPGAGRAAVFARGARRGRAKATTSSPAKGARLSGFPPAARTTYRRPSQEKIAGGATAGTSAGPFRSAAPVARSIARTRGSIEAPAKTRPRAGIAGPPMVTGPQESGMETPWRRAGPRGASRSLGAGPGGTGGQGAMGRSSAGHAERVKARGRRPTARGASGRGPAPPALSVSALPRGRPADPPSNPGPAGHSQGKIPIAVPAQHA